MILISNHKTTFNKLVFLGVELKSYYGGELTKPGKPFTPGTINYIMGNAGLMTAGNIAKVLHRSEKSVRRFAEKQGVSLKVG